MSDERCMEKKASMRGKAIHAVFVLLNSALSVYRVACVSRAWWEAH